MDRTQWNLEHRKVMTTFQWITVIPVALFLIWSDMPFWQEFLVLVVINLAVSLGGPFLMWWFAADGRRARRPDTGI